MDLGRALREGIAGALSPRAPSQGAPAAAPWHGEHQPHRQNHHQPPSRGPWSLFDLHGDSFSIHSGFGRGQRRSFAGSASAGALENRDEGSRCRRFRAGAACPSKACKADAQDVTKTAAEAPPGGACGCGAPLGLLRSVQGAGGSAEVWRHLPRKAEHCAPGVGSGPRWGPRATMNPNPVRSIRTRAERA